MRCLHHHSHKAHQHGGPVPLSALENTENGRIQQLRGGPRLRSRLAALGFTPGASITMLQNQRQGPVIVTLRDTRIVLGRGEAHRILIVPAES
jgi:ferrous iron transport protein A